MSETVKYKQLVAEERQLSIYDFIGEENNFLPEEKSQEVQPSETDPQVDEAQEDDLAIVDSILLRCGESPSSALDTRASNTLDKETYEAILEECEEAFQPTEDTDNVVTNSTLFSVGDVLTVKSPDEVYSMDTHPEDYYHLHEHQGKKVVITSRRKAYRGVFYGTSIEENGKVPFFYHRELKI